MSKYMIGADFTRALLNWTMGGPNTHSEPINEGTEATMKKRLPRRTCPSCKRVICIRKDGAFYMHRASPGAFFTWCAGSDRPAPKDHIELKSTGFGPNWVFNSMAEPGARFTPA